MTPEKFNEIWRGLNEEQKESIFIRAESNHCTLQDALEDFLDKKFFEKEEDQ